MGETEGTQEGTPQFEATPPDPGQSTPPQSYTQAQVDKMVQDAKTAHGRELADARRVAQESQTRTSTLESQISSLTQQQRALQGQIDAREMEGLQGNDDGLAAYRLKQEARQMMADADTQLAALRSEQAALQTAQTQFNTLQSQSWAANLASQYGVAQAVLLSHGGSTFESMESLAQKLPRTGQPPAGEPPPEPPPASRPDSMDGRGATAELTPEQIERMTAEEYAEHPSVKARFK